MPRVSVIMSVFNGQRHLRESIESILHQTFKDFEFIIVNDGSTDGTGEILGSYQDSRICVIHQTNAGLTKSLNTALSLARGEYIARQDADDISMPHRLEKQVSFLENNPEYGLVGTWAEVIDEEGKPFGTLTPKTSHLDIVAHFIFSNQFIHSSTMFRRSCIAKAGAYDESMLFAQDYDLWMRMSTCCKLVNLPEYLQKWRDNKATGISSRNRTRQLESATLLQKRYLSVLMRSETLKLPAKAYLLSTLPYLYIKNYVYHKLGK